MSHGGGGGGWGALKWLGLGLVAFWILWYYTGGPERAQYTGDDPFIRALEPLDTGQTYGPQNSKR